VEALLAAHDHPAVLPETRMVTIGATFDDRSFAYSTDTILAGRYKLLEEIAEGGMGTVWVAQQTEPVRRKVALKLIKPGMDSRRVLARFDVERQALAMMDHPNIAKVLDGGVTDQGRPFFVMEYVKGVPITDYCDQNRLLLEERLKLFVQVCHAVQHAHQKGIIHRDLKPSNVLVCLYDEQAVPKVIDFGLAKAMHEPLTDNTLHTAHGLMLGTPLYMSPEQAEFNNLDIDTRSDVYSLGVILYELLTGTTPLERKRFQEASWPEILRLIKEEEPPRPSAKLSGESALARIAANRRSEGARLERQVRGDLDWIVMKALEKERSRRYESASALTRDIERYLRNEPIHARSPSSVYRFRKFARRNRMALTTALLVASALLAGTMVSVRQAIRAMRAEAVADAERNEAERQRAAAEAHFRQARRAVDDYLTSVSESKLLNVPGLQPLRKELLESALTYYRQFIDQYGHDPSVQADLAAAYVRVGDITRVIGSQEEAMALLERAVRAYERLTHEQPASAAYSAGLARAYSCIGDVQFATSRVDGSETSYRRALALYEKLAAGNPGDDDYRSRLADLYIDLGSVQCALERLNEAEGSQRRALAIYEPLARHNPRVSAYQAGLARAYENLGSAQRKLGQMSDAEVSGKRAVDLREKLVAENPGLSEYRHHLAEAYNGLYVAQVEAGHLPDADWSFQRTVDIYEMLVRENPLVTDYREQLAHKYFNLGYAQRLAGHRPEAEASYRQSLGMYEQLAFEHPTVGDYPVGLGTAHLHLGILRSEVGQNEEAEQSWKQASADFSHAAELGYATATVFSGLGDSLAMRGEWSGAADAFFRAADVSHRAWKMLYQLALLQLAAGDEASYRATCSEFASRYGAGAGRAECAAIAMACMAGEGAVEDFSDVLAIAQRAADSDRKNPVLQTLLGAVQFRARRTEEAIATLEKALPAHALAELAAPKQLDPIRISRLTAETMLALAYREQGNNEAFAKHLQSLRQFVAKLEATTPQHSEGIAKWALSCALHLTKRQLERLDAS
jgi:serine/threonine protein kinase/tetratricopeptide (TPR) repeat protein